LMDLDVEVGLRRRAKGGEWNRLDALEVAFYQRVREGYFALAALESQRWVVVDAAQPPELVYSALCQLVLERLA